MIGHVLLALGILFGSALFLRSLVAGAAGATAWAVSREITQAEYRWIETYGNGLRESMPWWGGLDYRVWQRVDPWLDWIVPSLAAIILAFLFQRKNWLAG